MIFNVRAFLLLLSLVAADEYIATGYAPLDPGAVCGMCYSGDPTVTASGRETKPGVTVAVDKSMKTTYFNAN